ncbi:MAG: PEP-CTERM sorting domain-containing protein [Planctomycetota bacterium]|jgi:hypothetical protein
MMTRKLFVLFCILLFAISPFTSALIIGFEELHPGSEMSGIDIPDGYMGFDWSVDFNVITSQAQPGTGYEYGTTGSAAAYTSYHNPVSFTSSDSALFDFLGADITAKLYENDPFTVEGWRLGSQVYSVELTTSPDGPYSFDFNFYDVDLVIITPNQAAGDHHLVIDQIEVIPEPATLLLLAAGFVILFQLHSKKRLIHHHH